MIAADRQELESRLKQLTLQIREKEVTVFTENFAVISTQSAFLTGLGFSGLTMVPTWARENADDDPPLFVQDIFYSLVSISIGFNILTLAISSWCMIFGPGLAIRGPDGSMSRAVAGMYQERKWALRFFWAGLIFIMLSGVALGWLKFQFEVSLLITCIFIIFSTCAARAPVARAPSQPRLPPHRAVGIMLWYVRFVTRPRFKFPEGALRKPTQFHVAGFDPETGTKSQEGASPSGGGANVAAGSGGREAVATALKELQWLTEQGLIPADEAAARKNGLINGLLGSNDASSVTSGEVKSGTSSLKSRFMSSRQNSSARLGTKSGSKGGVSFEGDDGPSTSPIAQGSVSAGSTSGGGSAKSLGSQYFDSLSGANAGNTRNGVLKINGKPNNFSLSAGTLRHSLLDGTKPKEIAMRGQPVQCRVTDRTGGKGFTVTIGRTQLKLEANNEAEAREWMIALEQATLPEDL